MTREEGVLLDRLEAKVDDIGKGVSDLTGQVAVLNAHFGWMKDTMTSVAARLDDLERDAATQSGVVARVEELEKSVKTLEQGHQQVRGAIWTVGVVWAIGTAIVGYLLGGKA